MLLPWPAPLVLLERSPLWSKLHGGLRSLHPPGGVPSDPATQLLPQGSSSGQTTPPEPAQLPARTACHAGLPTAQKGPVNHQNRKKKKKKRKNSQALPPKMPAAFSNHRRAGQRPRQSSSAAPRLGPGARTLGRVPPARLGTTGQNRQRGRGLKLLPWQRRRRQQAPGGRVCKEEATSALDIYSPAGLAPASCGGHTRQLSPVIKI